MKNDEKMSEFKQLFFVYETNKYSKNVDEERMKKQHLSKNIVILTWQRTEKVFKKNKTIIKVEARENNKNRKVASIII